MSKPNWYLEGIDSEFEKRIVRTPIRSLPFSIGRRSSCDLPLNSKMVSQQHAELFMLEENLWLRDLGSTNGTFVNGSQIRGEKQLDDGDIVHFANLEFRLVADDPEPSWLPVTQTIQLKEALAPGTFQRFRDLREMLNSGAIQALFQPVVALGSSKTLGYEVLGRGLNDGEVISPGELFAAAEMIGLAEELSVAFRARGMEEARKLPHDTSIFLNTHPIELENEKSLLSSLRDLRRDHPDRKIVLEIHESSVANSAALTRLSKELESLSIPVAFDDFGTGQARLAEFTDAPPDYLKFDVAFIRDIHQATPRRREMISTLVKLARDMGVVTIAEGVEVAEESATCVELGFECGQGYFLARPAPVETFL